MTLEGVSPLSDERYVMITFLSGIEFWVPARKGMEHAAKQLGVKTVYQGTEKYDAIDEARVLEQVLAGGPTGILITAQNPDALRPGIDKAIASGVSVVMFNSDSPKSKRPVFLAGDNYQIGKHAGANMVAAARRQERREGDGRHHHRPAQYGAAREGLRRRRKGGRA